MNNLIPIHPKHDGYRADANGLFNFRLAMEQKLMQKRVDGRGGWHDPEQCSVDYLRQLLVEHVDKGDMVDVANFAMMIWNRENSVEAKL